MANIANVKVKAGNVLELSGSSVSISGSEGLNLHTAHGGISANAGTGSIVLSSDGGTIQLSAGPSGKLQLTGSAALKGDLNVSGTITAHTLNIVETTVTTLAKEGSTKFGNDSSDNHQFSGSLLLSGSMTIATGAGQFNGSGAGLTNIPNVALSNSAIEINGTSVSLGSSITTVAAGNGLAGTTATGTVTLSVKLSGSDSGLVVDGGAEGGVKLSGSVARLDRANTFSGLQTFSTAVSASQMTGSTALVGTLTLENDLAVAHGGTGLSTTPTNGQLLIGNGAGYTLATLTSGSNKVTITNGAGSISIDINPDAVAGDFVNKSGEQNDITGAKTFDKITVSGSGGLTLTGAAPLVASGSVEVLGITTLNGATIVGKSLDLDGILTVVAAATGSVTNDHSVVMAADNSEVVLQAAATGRVVIVKKVDAGTSAKGVEIQASVGQTIDGAGTYGLYGPYQSVTLIGSGSSWFVL